METELIDVEQQLVHSILVLGGVVEARDAYTGGHLWRVTQYAKLLGQKIGLDRHDLFRLTLAGYVHDLGKVGIPDEVLGKRGPLSDAEFAVIKTHPVIGSDLVRAHPLGHLLDDVVRHHHERLDGKGYPDGIGGSEISLLAAITGVADVFDALTSSRPYRAGMPVAKALGIMRSNAGTHHPADVLDALDALAAEGALDRILRHSSDNQALIECATCGPIVVLPEDPHTGDSAICPSCRAEFQIEQDGSGAWCGRPTGTCVSTGSIHPRADMKAVSEVMTLLG